MSVSDLARGAVVSGYRVEALLGRGGMGVVYLAEDLRLKRRVALKLLAPELAEDEGFRERFLRESELAASLDHPNVVPVYEAGESEGVLYIAMRYVEGADLKTLLAEGPLEPARAVAIVGQVGEALDAAHERGLVHRDVKPSNVLVDGGGHAYLGDFGLTRPLAEPGLGLPLGASLGTPDYVAPEQIRGEQLDGRADVYSLACLLYESLTGAPPFRGGTEAALLFAHLEEEPPTLPKLEAVLARGLAKAPDERYTTCRALVEEAREALGIATTSRARWPFAIATVSLAAIAAVSAFFLTRGGGGPPARHLGDGRVVRVDAASGEVVSTLPFGSDLSAVSADSDTVWVGSLRTGTLGRIDARTGKLLAAISVAGARQGPSAVAAADGVVWVVDGGDDKLRLYHVGERTFSSFEPRLPDAGSAGCACPDLEVPAVARGSVLWTVSAPNKTLERFVADEISSSSTPLGKSGVSGLAVGAGAVWAVSTLGSGDVPTLYELDARTNRLLAKKKLGSAVAPAGVVAGERAVWIADVLSNVVLRVDPRTLRVTARIPVGNGPTSLAVGNGSVWVANNLDGTLSRIDARTNQVGETLKVGGWPDHVAAGGGSVWVTLDPPTR